MLQVGLFRRVEFGELVPCTGIWEGLWGKIQIAAKTVAYVVTCKQRCGGVGDWHGSDGFGLNARI